MPEQFVAPTGKPVTQPQDHQPKKPKKPKTSGVGPRLTPSDGSSSYAPTTWGQEPLYDLRVPSGQLCQVRQPGPQGLVSAGVMDSMDTLTSIVSNELIAAAQGKDDVPAVKPDQVDPAEMAKQFDALKKVLDLADAITAYVVVQPNVRIPVLSEPREEGIVYTDMLPMDDRMFIMQFAMGGTSDLETFRAQSQGSVGGMAALAINGDASQ